MFYNNVLSGLALLIDIERYENDVQEQRIGSDVDVENLSELLKGLEFDVAIHRNLHLAAFFKVCQALVDISFLPQFIITSYLIRLLQSFVVTRCTRRLT